MNEREENVLKGRLTPFPQKIQFRDGGLFRITEGFKVTLKVPVELRSAEALLSDTAFAYWNARPEVSRMDGGASVPAEGYRLNVTSSALELEASDCAGLRNALKTLRQLAEPEREVKVFSDYLLVQCTIDDEPLLAFRGIHLCWFPETPAFEIEKQIRLAAYYKFNYVVLEPWGVFPYESHPEFCWRDRAVPRAEFKRMLSIARELGITLIPQINLFGHGSWSRISSGKHAFLDYNLQLQSLMEPDGWSWCLSNPETKKILRDLVLELHEFFGNPAYFHIGCDEADNAFSCAVCRKTDQEKVIADHIAYFRDLLTQRGAKAMMWHDMLLQRDDPRWKGAYVRNGYPEIKNILPKLPKDVIICDWQYDNPVAEGKNEADWVTSKFLKNEGFDVIVCPWLHAEGTLSLGKMAGQEKLFGFLMTTWHMNHGGDLFNEFFNGALAAWTKEFKWLPHISCYSNTNHHLRQIGWDMKVSEYEQTGRTRLQIMDTNTPECRA